MPLKDWSTTAASNTSAPPNGAPEGMTIANVNNVIRQVMADTRTLAAEDTIASAATCDLGTKDATFLTVSGTTTITGFGTVSAGIYKFVRFSDALTLTHNATSLILLSGANRTTVAGDCGLYKSEGSGNWREYFYSKQTDYQPLDAELTTLSGITAQQATDLAAVSTFMGTVLNDADAATARATLGAAPATTYIESDLAAASKIALTSAAAANITSISLTAGEWDVSGVVVFDPAATTSVTVKRGSISLTSAAIDVTLGRFFGHGSAASVDAGNASSYASKIVRLSLGATTTVYLVASSTFTDAAMSAYGNISARKVA